MNADAPDSPAPPDPAPDNPAGARRRGDRTPGSRVPGSRIRREPPEFRQMAVRRVSYRSPRLVRVTFAGPELAGLELTQPAASVRLLLPPPGTNDIVVPAWHGNEFLLPDGRRPTLRTFTPVRVDPDALELDLDVVLHGAGAASAWAGDAQTGDPAAVSGPGRGYAIDPDAPAFFLAGDETAVPAIEQVVGALPPEAQVWVHVEISHPSARIDLPPHPSAVVEWHQQPAEPEPALGTATATATAPGPAPGDRLVEAIRAAELPPGTQIWAAGEAAAMQRIRRHLNEERAWPRSQATVRGYWKHGRSGGDGSEP